MNTTPALSVIIPVYNVAPFLQECMRSLLTQRFADFELLLIDDGSTDGSGGICDKYADIDSRVIVFHQENGGASSARNRGIESARGEFIVFVDADDIVNDDYLKHLMESDADMVVTGIQKFGTKNGTSMPAQRDDFGIGGLSAHWNTPPDMNYLYCYPVAKRFRARIILEQRIRFNESLFFSEDMCFNMSYYSYATSFTELPFADYLYRIEDISRNEKYRMSAEQLITHFEYLDFCFQQLYDRVKAESLSFVRDDTALRMIRKFFFFLMQDSITMSEFIDNIKRFRNKDWADYLLSLLRGKKERRVMNEAVRFPFLTYCIEVRLQKAINRIIH